MSACWWIEPFELLPVKKAEIRKLYQQKRETLSPADCLKLDDLILIQFQKLGFEDIHLLLSYIPMQHKVEPNTDLYTRYLLLMQPGLHVAYPVTDFSNSNMQAFVVNDDTEYITTSYGIDEPKGGIPVEASQVDIVFVPLLAVDKKGYRVGYGKGFYDRYLKDCRQDVLKIGFTYFDAIDEIEDKDIYDIPLSYCVTPNDVWQF